MTHDEAVKVLEIMSSADGGCHLCVENLFRKFLVSFPEFISVVESAWKDNIPYAEDK